MTLANTKVRNQKTDQQQEGSGIIVRLRIVEKRSLFMLRVIWNQMLAAYQTTSKVQMITKATIK